MGLFTRLLDLHPLHSEVTPQEDFFSEVVAYLFVTSPDTLKAWIETLGIFSKKEYTKIHVSTQTSFDPLESHLVGSRPDIVIELSDGENRDIIFIESKIGSVEGPDQLKRYAEILNAMQDVQEKVLLYITRYFEPKDAIAILGNIPALAVHFKQLRWHMFYHFLQQQPHDFLIDEIITFMEDTGMAQDNQFTSIDVLALANFRHAFNLMSAAMWGKVSSRFEETAGTIFKSGADNWTNLMTVGGYWMKAPLGGKWDWYCGLGFELPADSITGYPHIELWIEVASNTKHRQKIVAAMKDVCRKRPEWKSYDLDQLEAESGIYRWRSLQEFLAQEDHIEAIEAYLLELLDDLASFKKKYPALPW